MSFDITFQNETKTELSEDLTIAPLIAFDKVLFSTKKYLHFSYFSTKTYVVGAH